MNFLKKTHVAVVLTLLVVALCCVWGYARSAPDTSSDQVTHSENRRAGESNLNYYLGWIDDGATLFSLETLDALARYDLQLDSSYGSLLAVKTVWHLSGMDIETYAQNTADHLNLGSRDLLLLLDANSEDWYVTYGAGIRSYVEGDDSLGALFAKHLGEDFFGDEGNGNQAILALFGNLLAWYEDHVPPLEQSGNPIFHLASKSGAASLGGILSGIFFTLAVNFWWIVLLFLVLYGLDSVRFNRYYARAKQGDSPKTYHPFLFWHAPGSRWFQWMTHQAEQRQEDEEELPDEEPDGEPKAAAASEPEEDPLGPDGPTAGAGGDSYRHGPGYSTDPNEPGPFGPRYSTDPNEPGPFGPRSAGNK